MKLALYDRDCRFVRVFEWTPGPGFWLEPGGKLVCDGIPYVCVGTVGSLGSVAGIYREMAP